jgi:hypothetical protein
VRRAGISVTLYVMVGFPTETRAEARATLDTILANRESIQEVSVRVFYLDERSEVFKRASEFAIEELFPDPLADLQVYYDFRASEGMTRREAREAYLEFTRELRSHFPVFQNTNMLYHELKSHYFLYLARHGTWERLVSEVLERAPDAPAVHPRARGRFVSRELAFDRGSIDARLASIDSHTLRPRYQSDLVEDADRERFDRELDPEPRGESVLLYAADSGEVHALSPAAAELLASCDGRRSLDAVLEPIPAPHRDAALACLRQLAAANLITPLPEEVSIR